MLPSIFVVGPVLMRSEYDGARSWALVTACFGVGNILGDVLLLRWRPPYALRVGALMLVGASCQAAIIGSHLPVWGIGGPRAADRDLRDRACSRCGRPRSASTSRPQALSRVSSYDYLSTTGVIPLGNLLVGLAAATFGAVPDPRTG